MTRGQQFGLLIAVALAAAYFFGPAIGLAEHMPSLSSFGGDEYDRDDAWWKSHRESHRLGGGEPFFKMPDTGHNHGHHR